jgi:hypothetical protein
MMEQAVDAMRECPLCREEIRADAVRCKHCQGSVTPETPGHGGVCPLCKEQIHPEAIRCKHCHGDLTPTSGCADAGGCSDGRRLPPSANRRYRRGGYRLARQRADAAGGIVTGPTHPGSACPAWIDDNGWFGILVDWDDRYCTYEEY